MATSRSLLSNHARQNSEYVSNKELRFSASPKEHATQRTAAQNNRDQREHQRLGIGAAQFPALDPRLQIPGHDLNELSQMPAQKRVEIVAQFQGAVLQQAQQLRLLLQGCRNQFKRACKGRAPVLRLSQSRQQFAAQLNTL